MNLALQSGGWKDRARAFRDDHERELALLALLLGAALLVRLVFIGQRPFLADMKLFTKWAETLITIPIREFYSRGATDCDYLPGYLYLLGATGLLRARILGSVGTPQEFGIWIKIGPLVADLVLGAAVYLLCRRIMGVKRSLVVAGLVLFNPALILVSTVWGQVDSVGAVLPVMSLLALVYSSPILAGILAGMAFVVKPHYTVFLVVMGVAYMRKELLSLNLRMKAEGREVLWKWFAMRIVLPVVGLLAAAQLLCLPFSVSVWPQPGTAWTVFGRLDFAGSRFPVTSANAFNLWAIIAGIDKPDLTKGWLGVSLRDWSLLMFATFAALAMLVAWLRAKDTAVVLWGCAAVACAFFVLPTRIHERYLFIAIPLLAVSAVYSRWLIPHFVVATGLYFFNVWYEYATLRASGGEPLAIDISWLILPASFVSVFLFVGCLAALVGFGFRQEPRGLEHGNVDGGREPQRTTSSS